MPYRIGKTFSFSAAHHLPSLPETHKCHNVHGHNYTVTIELESTDLDEHGFILDYADLSPFRDYIEQVLDHQDLNEVFDYLEPTAENLAGALYHTAVNLDLGPLIRGIRVCETPNTYAEFVSW